MSFDKVLRAHQNINSLARSMIRRTAFDELHVILPDPNSPEPGFIRATSWLYCLYFEAGQVSLTFLRRLGEAYAIVDRESSDRHVEAVRCLRTELHHNLGFADSDHHARTAAEIWRRKACGTVLPHTDEEWRSCYDRLIDDAYIFLGGINDVVRRIESEGEMAQAHIDQWLQRLDRSWTAAEFDPLVEDAKFRLGRNALNTVAFRNRSIDRWRKQLELLDDGFDFNFEVTRLIEKTLLDEDSIVLPITGRDIIESINIKPGPQVGALLEEARRHFVLQPCSGEDLLAHISDYYQKLG
jgi:hypothetical protein